MLRLKSTWLAMRCLLCLLAGLTRCASPPLQYAGTEPQDEIIYVIAAGWHTELALPMSAISPFLVTELDFANARYLVFGWGARDYYMARDPGFGDLLRAAVPGPAVLLVMPLQVSPEAFAGAANVFAVPVSRIGAEHLSQFLREYLASDAKGASRRIGSGPYTGSAFYASTGTFDLAHTCNTWTAEALRAAGVPVTSAGIIYAGQLLDRVRPLAVASPR